MLKNIIRGMMILGLIGLFNCGIETAKGSDGNKGNSHVLKAKYAKEIKRKRIAIFHEEGFPSKSPRPAEWYKKILTEAGLKAAIIGVKELSNIKTFSRKNFDTLLVATGGHLPADSEEAIGIFMENGGNIIIDESIMIGCSNLFWGEFELNPWNSHYSTGSNYFRPFTEDLKQNPVLERAGLLKAMPEIVSMDKASSARKDGMMRIKFPQRGFRPTQAPEYANDFLIPIYVFSDVSNYAYPHFKSAGKQKKDCDSDFYIYRRHSVLKDGSTLIHFGRAGARLLRSDKGKETLLAALHLAESTLPGERSQEFIDNCHRLDKELSNYYGKSIEVMETLKKAALVYHYRNKVDDEKEVLALIRKHRKAFKEIARKGEILRNLMFEKGAVGNRERVNLIKKCSLLSKEIESMQKKYNRFLSRYSNQPEHAAIKNRFKKIQFSFLYAAPCGITRLKGLYPLLKEIGMSTGPWFPSLVGGLDHTAQLFKETGIKTGFRMAHGSHPSTLKRIKSPENIKRLEEMNKREDIGFVSYLSEYNMRWSLWGKEMEKKFRKYLRKKYEVVDRLNECWGSSYGNFADVTLPSKEKRPITQVEHAIWEDWTRYREIFRVEEQILPQANIVKKYAPNLYSSCACSSHLHDNYPATGVNLYEQWKFLDPNTFEMTSYLKHEVLAADIAGFFHRNLTSEWGVFYFPPSSQPDKIDLLKEQLWKGIGWGQIGWHTFMGSIAGCHYTNWINVNNRIMPLGWQLKEVNKDFLKIDHILLDGEREEPSVRILYSLTTKRHTCWPGIEKDKSISAVCGYYLACQNNHTPARAIDEGAIMDGYLPGECRFLILPQVTYMNSDLFGHIKDFIENGGCILMTPDTGQYDQYGHKLDSLLSLAGISLMKPADRAVNLGNGKRYSSVHTGKVCALSVQFPEETEVILRFESGEAAVTYSRVGKGGIIVTGIPFGLDYNSEGHKRPDTPLLLLSEILDAAGVEPVYSCSDIDIVVRPWHYKEKKYLIITNPIRKKMVVTSSSGGGFPFSRPSDMTPFTLKIKGSWQIKDYLLGVSIPAEFDGEQTIVKGMVSNPGGMIYEIKEGKQRKTKGVRKPDVKKNIHSVSVLSNSNKTHKKKLTLPFTGRLFARDGDAKIDNYLLTMDVESKGMEWGGDFYLQIEYEGEKIRKLCATGSSILEDKTIVFNFINKTLNIYSSAIDCVMPVNIKCRIVEEDAPPLVRKCIVREEQFCGQKSILMENEYLKVRILPGIGGRIIEFVSKRDVINHMYCDKGLVAQGAGDSWVNYGGLEENAGAFPGPFWNAEFDYKIIRDSPEEVIVVLLRTKPIKWDHGGYGSGVNSLEKKYILRRGESKLLVEIKEYNDSAGVTPLRFVTHPLFAVGGDVTTSDIFYYPVGQTVKMIPYSADISETFKNKGSWASFIDRDRKKGIIQVFSEDEVAGLYTWMGGGQYKGYNFEITTVAHEVEPGKYLAFNYELGLLKGISGLAGFAGDVGVNVTLSGIEVYGESEEIEIKVEIGSLSAKEVSAGLSIENEDEEIANISNFKLEVKPEFPYSRLFKWNTGKLPDGKYFVSVKLCDEGNNEILVSKKGFVLAGRKQKVLLGQLEKFREELKKVKEIYSSNKSLKLKQDISRIAILLGEMEEAIRENRIGEVKEVKDSIEKLLSATTNINTL